MIELLLQAERALSAGLVDQAERLYAQAAAADPRSSIAVVGLARVALERKDDATAYRLAREALGIDPENVAAARLVGRLEEVYAHRGLPVPGPEPEKADGRTVAVPAAEEPAAAPAEEAGEAAVGQADDGVAPAAEVRPATPATPEASAQAVEPTEVPTIAAPVHRSLLDRLLGRNQP